METLEKRPHPRAKGGSARGAQTSPHRVRDFILASIRAGILTPASPLDEQSLMDLLQASRGSVRAALTELTSRGVLARRPRTGTRVRSAGIYLPINDVSNTSTCRITIQILDQRLVPASPFLRLKLGTDDEQIRLVENAFIAGDDIIGIRTAYFPVTVSSNPEHIKTPVPMRALIETFFGREPGDVKAWVSAEASDPRTSRLMRIAEGTALLRRELLYRDESKRPIQIVFDAFRADMVTLEQDSLLIR
jgi:GntR family transcriptional regulator